MRGMGLKCAAAVAFAGWLITGAAFGAASARFEKDQVILQNEFVEMAFAPAKGGRCVSFKYMNVQFENSPFGSFEDRIWEIEDYDLPKASYKATILQAGPDTASVSLDTYARSPGYSKLELTRVITLRAGRSDIEVTSTFTNHDEQTLPVGYWVFSDFSIPGHENVVTFPGRKGLDRMYFNHGTPPEQDARNASMVGGERWLYDNPRAFMGWNSAGGPGLAISFDLPRLSMLYDWTCGTDITTEFAFNELPIAPGKQLVYNFVLLPFHGLPSFDGAQGPVAVSLETPKEVPAPAKTAVQVTLVSGGSKEVAVRLRAKLLPKGDWAAVAEKPLSLKPDSPAAAQFDWTPAGEGTWVVSVQAFEGQDVVVETEKPVVVGRASATYAMTTDVKRIGKEMPQYRNATVEYQEDPARVMEAVNKYGFLRPIDLSVVTPHIEWGKPLAGGPLRVLFLPSWYTGREVVEMAERLDVKVSYVALLRERDWPPAGRKGTKLYSALESAMVEKLKGDVQVIALSDCPCPWKDLRPETVTALLDAVKGGKGLVYAGNADALLRDMGTEFVKDAPAAKALGAAMPAWVSRGSVNAGTYGKGRVVLLGYGGGIESNSLLFSRLAGGVIRLNDPERESACSLLGKSLVWAAHPLTVVARSAQPVALSLPSRVALESEATQGSAVKLEVTGRGLSAVDWFIQPADDVPPMAMPRVPGAEGALTLSLPHLAAGNYSLYAIGRDARGGALDWTASTITVTTDATLAVRLDKSHYEVQDTAVASVTAGKGTRKGMSVQCELLDVKGRVMSRQVRKLEDEQALHTVEFKLPLALAAAKMVIARASLLSGTDALTSAEATASVVIARAKGYRYIPYAAFFREEADLVGMGSMMGWSETAAKLNLDNYIWTGLPQFDVEKPYTLNELVRKPCLSDPAYIKSSSDFIQNLARTMSLYGDLAAIITDEWNYAGRDGRVTNLCHSPTCNAAFHKFLQDEYKTLDALNASWGSAYKNWEEVDAPRWEEVLRDHKFVPWIDKRRAQETVVGDFLKSVANAGKQVYPDFRLSFSGTANPTSVNGFDWWKLMHSLDAVSLYGGPQMQIARSFAGPNHLLTRWIGYDSADEDPGFGAQRIWQTMLVGLGGGCDFSTTHWSPLFWPDYTPRRYALAVAEAYHSLEQGSGELVVNSTMDDDGVAILYEQSSVHMAAAESVLGKPVDEGTYVDTLSSCEALLRDVGLQFRYVAGQQVAEGILKTGGYRLLVVPFSEAVSPEELAAIQEFAKGGGVVLADMAPAFADQHGKKYDLSPLDAVLGVARPQHQTLFRQGDVAVRPQPEYDLKGLTLKLMLGETDLALSTATAWASFDNDQGGKTPAITFNAFGNGMGILLNFGLADYQGYRASGTGGETSVVVRARAEKTQAMQSLMKAVLAAAGIHPHFTIAADPAVDSEFSSRFRSGQAVYLGMCTGPKESHKVKVTLSGLEPAERYIYNVRAHKYVGHADSFEHTMKGSYEYDKALKGSYAELFALMPAKIGSVSVKAQNAAERGQAVPVAVKLSGWTPEMGVTVFRIEVYRPDGQMDKLYTKNVLGKAGAAEVTVPFALNDPAGKWRVVAVEAVSGNSDDVKIEVR